MSSVNHRGMPEMQRLLADRVAAHDVVARELPLRTLELLARSRPSVLTRSISACSALLHDSRLLPLLHDRHRVEEVRVLDELGLAERSKRDLLLIDERAMQARAVAVRQNLRQDVQRVRVGCARPA